MVDLTFEDLEDNINIISTGMKLVELERSNETRETLIFKQPTPADRMLARSVYKRTYDEAKAQGLKTIEEMEQILRDRGILTEELENDIAKLESKIDAQRTLLYKTTKVQANRERLLGVISKMELELRELRSVRDSKLGLTIEAKANEAKFFFLCFKGVFVSDNESLWKTDEEFNLERDLLFRSTVIHEYSNFSAGLPTRIIRYIARSNLWRVRYITAIKCSADLFGIPVKDYSSDMVNLLYWSHFYQNIYEMLPDDQPPEDIVEDDDALDAFMEAFYKEMKQEKAARHSSQKHKKIDAFNSNEVIVTAAHELSQDIEYDKPREAQLIKERADVKKRTKRKRLKR